MSEKTNYLTAKVVIEVTNHGWKVFTLLPNGKLAIVKELPKALSKSVHGLNDQMKGVQSELNQFTNKWCSENINEFSPVENLENHLAAQYWENIYEKETEEELKRLKGIETRWHALSEKIAKFYINEEGEPFEDEEGGNLCDIGEAAASAFGWL